MAIDMWGTHEPGQAPLLYAPLPRLLKEMHRRLEPQHPPLLHQRRDWQGPWDRGIRPSFLPEMEGIGRGEWQGDPVSPDLADRRIEITGATHAKMLYPGTWFPRRGEVARNHLMEDSATVEFAHCKHPWCGVFMTHSEGLPA